MGPFSVAHLLASGGPAMSLPLRDHHIQKENNIPVRGEQDVTVCITTCLGSSDHPCVV